MTLKLKEKSKLDVLPEVGLALMYTQVRRGELRSWVSCSDLLERLELLERTPKYRKDQRIIGN